MDLLGLYCIRVANSYIDLIGQRLAVLFIISFVHWNNVQKYVCQAQSIKLTYTTITTQ